MLKAIVQKGGIVPLDPLPPEWGEGTSLEVFKADVAALDIDAWVQMMDRLCADSPAQEEERMQTAINEHRRQAKAQARRDMGLSE
jgi:hypothetical protein